MTTRYDCRRCTWEPETTESARDDLRAHADESGHPLCAVCRRSLGDLECLTCLPCLADTRHRLGEIVDLYALLPGTLERMPSPSDWRRSGSRSTDTTLPGGDGLSLLSPGSEGRWAQGQPHNAANLRTDPPSVAFELARWEDTWREYRHEPAAPTEPTVSTAVAYLMRRMGWAADNYPEFGDFAHEVKRLLATIKTTTATAERDDIGAACLTCGTDLRRPYSMSQKCHHSRPSQRLKLRGERLETTVERDARLVRWAEDHLRCDQGGQQEGWHCPRCQREYTPEEYRLAVAAEMRLRRDAATTWVPLATAARLVGRTYQTVRRWVDRGDVEEACDIQTRRVGVWLPSVFRTDTEKQRRRRAA